jgi:hypothetical protein
VLARADGFVLPVLVVGWLLLTGHWRIAVWCGGVLL